MTNITTNLVDTVVSPADNTIIRGAFTTLQTTAAPYLHPLTPGERDSFNSLDVDNKIFCDEALQEVTNNGAILPPAINPSRLQNDLTLFEQMDEYESLLGGLLKAVQETKRVAGHEAYAMARAAYHMYVSLAEAGVEGARQSADRLGERFRRNGSGRPAPENNPPAA